MSNHRIAELFFVAGIDESKINAKVVTPYVPNLPIVDLAVINKTQGETVPAGFECLELTPTNFPANMNHGSLFHPEMYLCFRRGNKSAPILEIGIQSKDNLHLLRPGCKVIVQTPTGLPANINNSYKHVYVTYYMAEMEVGWVGMAVSDISIILPKKGELPPHCFTKIDKNLNLGFLGSDVFLCYKKSSLKRKCLTFEADILFKYPKEDNLSMPLAKEVSPFCFLQGPTIDYPGDKITFSIPTFSTFVLTDVEGNKFYGTSLTFYRDFRPSNLTPSQRKHFEHWDENNPEKNVRNFQQTQAICLLSRWPFFEAFKNFLNIIYGLSISGAQAIPIEKYILFFLSEAIFPSPENPYRLIQFYPEEIVLLLPEKSPFPISGGSYTKMLLNLGVENSINLFLCVLLEHKIVLSSSKVGLLTIVAETISSMIFPFSWQCPYVPMLPLSASEAIQAPTPFIIGLNSSYFDQSKPEIPPENTYCHIDARSVLISQDNPNDNLKLFSQKPLDRMRESLLSLHKRAMEAFWPGTPEELSGTNVYRNRDSSRQLKQSHVDLDIKEVFLKFMCDLMRNYSSYMRIVKKGTNQDTGSLESLFNVQEFLRSKDPSYQNLLKLVVKSQYFSKFIDDRSLGAGLNGKFDFFDTCIKITADNPKAPLKMQDDKMAREQTSVISFHQKFKEFNTLSYEYNSFADLKIERFEDKLHTVR